MGAIYRRELMAYFTSPLGYVYSAIFFAFSGFLFTIHTFGSATTNVSEYFGQIIMYFIILIPILTMKLFSEEKKMGTEMILMTSPVSLIGVVCAKFLAAFTLFAGTFCISAIINVTTLINTAEARNVLREDLNLEIFGGCVASILFVGAALISIGVFISSLTENQMIAAVVSIGIFAVLIVGSSFVRIIESEWLRKALKSVLILDRFDNFQRGIFDVTSIVYYISIVTVFLFLTIRVYEKRRWS